MRPVLILRAGLRPKLHRTHVQPGAGSVKSVKRDGSGTPTIVALAVVLCVVAAIGAGLEGPFSFAGPLLTPGLSLTPPQTKITPSAQPPATGTPHYSNQNTVFPWSIIIVVLGILALAVIVVFVLLWLRYRPRRSRGGVAGTDIDVLSLDQVEPEAADLPTLHRGLVRAAELLSSDREPRDAIVRAWIGLQEAAEDSGMTRRAAETATEFTSRVFESVDADRDAANTLLALYLRVRFGANPATPQDVEKAQKAIADLTASWPIGVTR